MKVIICLLVFSSIVFDNKSHSQTCIDCNCGTMPFATEQSNPRTLLGGIYKPSRSDIGGAPSEESRFPVLIVFISFKDEPGDSTSTHPDAWPAGKPPNYLNALIDTGNIVQSDWWNSYNQYAVSDYWHEFSRGKMHVLGRTFHFKMDSSLTWYKNNGGMSIVNRQIYDFLDSQSLSWDKYDLWKYVSDGNIIWDQDNLVDMIYIVFRQWDQFLFDGLNAWGIAQLGPCTGTVNGDYTVNQNPLVKIRSIGDTDPLGSGVKIHADTGIYSKQRFLDLATHEHGHYLMGFTHKVYIKMSYRSYEKWEFSLSPWEVIKFGYLSKEITNYSNSLFNLYDYSSRGVYGSDTNEVLQVPISSDSSEFFLLANRRKVSDWDRRTGGDTLANERWQFLKAVNPEYGKGLYIYHVKDGYEVDKIETYNNDMDLECADGSWNYISAGVQRKRINDQTPTNVYVRQYPSYNNDSPESNPGYTSGKDDMSNAILFTQGSMDNFNTTPVSRGTHTLYTNDNDYWYSLASLGDRWDAWNVGYNEIFSPYSSPNTKDMQNNQTNIFIWYKALDTSNKKATIELYRTGYGGKSEAQILELTPPSRPMGLRVLSCDSLPTINGYRRIKLRWFHNMEPDMIQQWQGVNDQIKKYKIYRTTTSGMDFVPNDRMQFPENDYQLYKTVYIDVNAIPEFIDSALVSVCDYPYGVCPPYCCNLFPVRYRVQAVDKYETPSVLSDFAKTEAWNVTGPEPCAYGPDNFVLENNHQEAPKEFSLSNAFPNPFNPSTLISYTVPLISHVRITVYDINGKEIANLANSIHEPGFYEATFNAVSLPSGTYFCIMKAGTFAVTKKLVVVK